MAPLPSQFQNSPWYPQITGAGLARTSVGKVREGYSAPAYPDNLLVLATDRVSIYNFVLPALVPRKGEVLTAISHFMMTHLLSDFRHDMIVPECGPESEAIWGDWHQRHPDFPWGRCTIVRKFEVRPYEIIFRRHIGGSVWNEYLQTQTVAGIRLRDGLRKWERLPEALFTPTDKSEDDDPISVERFYAQTTTGDHEAVKMLRAAYDRAYAHLEERGILILDTKFEYALDDRDQPVLVDEKLTPDSSRFVDEGDWLDSLATGRDPAFRDKQRVRRWGQTVKTPFRDAESQPIVGIHKLKGSNPDHIAFVHGLVVPQELLDETSGIYLRLFEDVTGCDLDTYQRDAMRIAG